MTKLSLTPQKPPRRQLQNWLSLSYSIHLLVQTWCCVTSTFPELKESRMPVCDSNEKVEMIVGTWLKGHNVWSTFITALSTLSIVAEVCCKRWRLCGKINIRAHFKGNFLFHLLKYTLEIFLHSLYRNEQFEVNEPCICCVSIPMTLLELSEGKKNKRQTFMTSGRHAYNFVCNKKEVIYHSPLGYLLLFQTSLQQLYFIVICSPSINHSINFT